MCPFHEFALQLSIPGPGPWPFELPYPLQDGGSQFLSELFLVVPQVAGLILFILWKEGNGGNVGSLSGNSKEGSPTALLKATVTWRPGHRHPLLTARVLSLAAPTIGRRSYQAVPVGFCFGNSFLNGFFCHS